METRKSEGHERNDLLPSIRRGFDDRSLTTLQSFRNGGAGNLRPENRSAKSLHSTNLFFGCASFSKSFEEFARMFDESSPFGKLA